MQRIYMRRFSLYKRAGTVLSFAASPSIGENRYRFISPRIEAWKLSHYLPFGVPGSIFWKEENLWEKFIRKIDRKPATAVWLLKRASVFRKVAGLDRIWWQLSPEFAAGRQDSKFPYQKESLSSLLLVEARWRYFRFPIAPAPFWLDNSSGTRFGLCATVHRYICIFRTKCMQPVRVCSQYRSGVNDRFRSRYPVQGPCKT